MGREIRRVPKGWEHPKDEDGQYKPMYSEAYIDALNTWWENHTLWLKGEHPDQKAYPENTQKCKYYAQWDGDAPDIEFYNPDKWTEEGAPCFQMYETVSEGTPVSPVFDTLEDLKKWLVEEYGYTRERAEQFCEKKWLPTFTVYYSEKDGFTNEESERVLKRGNSLL